MESNLLSYSLARFLLLIGGNERLSVFISSLLQKALSNVGLCYTQLKSLCTLPDRSSSKSYILLLLLTWDATLHVIFPDFMMLYAVVNVSLQIYRTVLVSILITVNYIMFAISGFIA